MISLAAIFGFRNQSYSNSNKLLLFDACFDYIRSNSTIDNLDLKQDLLDLTGSSINVQSNKLIPIIPDSTVKPIQPVKIDSVKILVSSEDSLRIKTKQDSLKRIENFSKDSTARIKYFHFYRNDYPNVLFRVKKKSGFFVYPSESMLSRTVQLDSTGKKIIIKESIAGKQIREYLELPIDEYIKLKLEAIKRDVWEQKGYEYKLKDTKKDLSQLITDITNIEIPLPSSPLLSIFGPPHIKLNIAGQVDIHGAWRNETTTGITTSALGNTRNEPDFKQQVQINLNGTIGDKLTLGADWNTERQFQYENQLKIKYT
ncbi:MAG: cell surface protein SprA, partial [Ignavibacteriales bacterium]|nr:cell surface protein SprA [Ignavibacteriales bacterium]